jgi:hypothetical protein
MRQAALPIRIDTGHYTPNLKRRGLKSSAAECSYVAALTELRPTLEYDEQLMKDVERMRRVAVGKRPCLHRSFLYTVNHLIVPLCICHATRMSKRKGLKVRAA